MKHLFTTIVVAMCAITSLFAIPNNTIYYTSSNGEVVSPYKTNVFGANIVSNTYENCQGKIVFDGEVSQIGDLAFADNNTLESITIPSSVTRIGNSAFTRTNLRSIAVPDAVTSIGSLAFRRCLNLSNVFIGKGVSLLGSETFSFCSALTSMVVDANNVVYDSRENCNAIIETTSNTLVVGCKKTIIPNSVTKIGDDAFWGCDSLLTIHIPNSITRIGNNAFAYCYGLKDINIPSSVTYIGYRAFVRTNNLTSIVVGVDNPKYDSRDNCNAIISSSYNVLVAGCQNTIIPNSVTSIGSYSFFGNLGVIKIVIPSNITSISDNAFGRCSNLKDCYVQWESPLPISSDVFYEINLADATLHVPFGTKALYEVAEVWKDFGTIVEMKPELIEIADGTVYNRTKEGTTNVKYSRNFNNTSWQALYIPFSMKYEDFGDKLEIAWLNNVHMYDDNEDDVPDRTMLEFYIMHNGELEPNTPYLVRAKNVGTFEISLKDVTLAPAETNPFECSTFTKTFTVRGTYDGVTGTEMYNNHYYAPVGGKLTFASSTNASLKPQRWYLKVANKNGSPVTEYAPAIRMCIDGVMIDEEETTSIDLIDSKSSVTYYTLDGQKLSTKPSKSGLYILNNKKISVK